MMMPPALSGMRTSYLPAAKSRPWTVKSKGTLAMSRVCASPRTAVVRSASTKNGNGSLILMTLILVALSPERFARTVPEDLEDAHDTTHSRTPCRVALWRPSRMNATADAPPGTLKQCSVLLSADPLPSANVAPAAARTKDLGPEDGPRTKHEGPRMRYTDMKCALILELDSETLGHAIQRPAIDTQDFRRSRPVAAHGVEHVSQIPALEVVERWQI